MSHTVQNNLSPVAEENSLPRHISFEEICAEIAQISSISFVDAYSIIERLGYYMLANLNQGHILHLHGCSGGVPCHDLLVKVCLCDEGGMSVQRYQPQSETLS